MVSSAVRLAVFVPLAVWLSTQPGFHLEQLWFVSVMTVWIQAGVSYMLLRQQFKRRLTDVPRPAPAACPRRLKAGADRAFAPGGLGATSSRRRLRARHWARRRPPQRSRRPS